MKKFNKIAIIGVGLIGGSMGLVIRAKRLAREVVGVGRHRGSINKAIRLRTVDRGTLDLREGTMGADIVILATPILSMAQIVKKAIPYLKRGCIITDVGSTKLNLTEEIESSLPEGIYYVGSHPMAGSEKKGVDEARTDLFKNSICILTKTKKTSGASLKTVKTLWSALGAKVIVVSPMVHDRLVSEISHLPHMVIFSMLNSIDRDSLRFASSGFYDTTRIASSDASIWKDITISNKNEIIRSISKFKKGLLRLEKAIKDEDSAALLKIFRRAKEIRKSLL